MAVRLPVSMISSSYLFPHLRHHLFDACRVYAAVGHQLVQCQACYLAAHGVKAGKYDGLWGVVHYYLDSGSGFPGRVCCGLPYRLFGL